jgi:peroxiredoxin family protein
VTAGRSALLRVAAAADTRLDRRNEVEELEKPPSLVLFAGTDDKLTAAAVLAVGAAAMGRPVNLFLQYYALDAFRAGKIRIDHGLATEATAEQAPSVREHRSQHWSELLKQAKELGQVDIEACALSMDMYGIKKDDLDPLVDGVEGVAAFIAAAGDGQVVFV